MEHGYILIVTLSSLPTLITAIKPYRHFRGAQCKFCGTGISIIIPIGITTHPKTAGEIVSIIGIYHYGIITINSDWIQFKINP
jgi:hypothetical protein